MKLSTTVTQLVALALLYSLCLAVLAPLSEAKKKDFQEGTILDAQLASKTRYFQQTDAGAFPAGTKSHYWLTIQIEDLTYIGDYSKDFMDHSLAGLMEYSFKVDDWPINTPIEVRFEVKHFLGLRRTFMHVKRPNGKEIRLVVVRKVDEKGNELCGTYRC